MVKIDANSVAGPSFISLRALACCHPVSVQVISSRKLGWNKVTQRSMTRDIYQLTLLGLAFVSPEPFSLLFCFSFSGLLLLVLPVCACSDGYMELIMVKYTYGSLLWCWRRGRDSFGNAASLYLMWKTKSSKTVNVKKSKMQHSYNLTWHAFVSIFKHLVYFPLHVCCVCSGYLSTWQLGLGGQSKSSFIIHEMHKIHPS